MKGLPFSFVREITTDEHRKMMDYADDSFCILLLSRIAPLTPDPLPEGCADFEIPQHSGRGRKAIVLKPGQFF
jgi:hypothetical protein